MEDNIVKIRKDAIIEIKKKVKKNPEYLNPCNKKRLEDMKRFKFNSGHEFTCWMQQNDIMKNPADINREKKNKIIKNAGCNTEKEYLDKRSREAGFRDWSDRVKTYGDHIPREDPDCPLWLGYISEKYVMKTFEDPTIMPTNNPGFDWICSNGKKIDHKGACILYIKGKLPIWIFKIRHNKMADYFILSAWDNRESLTPLHVWIFGKNDIVRGRKFCEFESFAIMDTPEKLKEFEKWEVSDRLEKLKELCDRDKNKKQS